MTPLQRHVGQDTALLEARRTVYEAAKTRHPDRWRGRVTRNWAPIRDVWLNPDHPAADQPDSLPAAA